MVENIGADEVGFCHFERNEVEREIVSSLFIRGTSIITSKGSLAPLEMTKRGG